MFCYLRFYFKHKKIGSRYTNAFCNAFCRVQKRNSDLSSVFLIAEMYAPLCVHLFTAVQCPAPPQVQGADLIFDTSGIIKFGYVASYRCHFGMLIGASDIVCTEDGTWSSEAPLCEGKQKAIHIKRPVLYKRDSHTESSVFNFCFCILLLCQLIMNLNVIKKIRNLKNYILTYIDVR